MFIHFLVVLFVCHEDKNSAKYYFPTPEEKRKARIDVILMQIEPSLSWAIHQKTRHGTCTSELHMHHMNKCLVTSQCKAFYIPKSDSRVTGKLQSEVYQLVGTCSVPVDPAVAKSALKSLFLSFSSSGFACPV